MYVVLVWLEYRRRNCRSRDEGMERDLEEGGNESDREEDTRSLGGVSCTSAFSSVIKRSESVKTMVSFLWWIVGFHWVVYRGELMLQLAPRLYCLPCIIEILYVVAGQEGASEADLRGLLTNKFRVLNSDEEIYCAVVGKMIPQETSIEYLAWAHEQIMLPEDAE